MRNNLRESSRSLELLVLEPEINRDTPQLTQNSQASNWCFVKKKEFLYWKISFIPTTYTYLISILEFIFILSSRSSFSGDFFFNHSCILLNNLFYLRDLIRNHVKTILILYSYLRKYFTIKKQLLLVQIVYEFIITMEYPVAASYCIYTSDPQTTKIPLLPVSISMRRN